MKLHEIIQAARAHGNDIVFSLTVGSGSSVGATLISPEVIHGAWTLLFAAASTIMVFFLNRTLNYLFPKKKKE